VPIIEVEHLHKRYRDTVAVEDVSFAVEQGEIFGIIGPNGAGKTTTVETIEGLRTPDRGVVRVLGLDPWKDRAELRERVGVQLQQSDLYDKVRVGEALEARPASRPTCSTSTPSSASTTGPPPWPPRTNAAC
jgi:ABC-2 type transport system ATP-binding protein